MPEQTPQKTHSSFLKSTREAKGLTLDIVHEATKIPMDALKAIEEGYSVRILTPFYYRGFLKIYAEFLGVDPAEVLSHYEIQKPKPAAKPSGIYGSTGSPLGQTRRNEAMETAMEAAGDFFKKTFSFKNRKIMLRVAGILLAVFAVLKVGGCVAAFFKDHPVASAKGGSASGGKPAIAVKKTQKSVSESETAPVVEKPQVIKAIGSGDKVVLAVRAVKDTWVQVKTDGRIVFQMKMKKGTVESWDAKKQIELSGKNVNELDLEVNGEHVGALGSAERGAKRVLITKEGLTVKK